VQDYLLAKNYANQDFTDSVSVGAGGIPWSVSKAADLGYFKVHSLFIDLENQGSACLGYHIYINGQLFMSGGAVAIPGIIDLTNEFAGVLFSPGVIISVDMNGTSPLGFGLTYSINIHVEGFILTEKIFNEIIL
jgi:hypothetical protein